MQILKREHIPHPSRHLLSRESMIRSFFPVWWDMFPSFPGGVSDNSERFLFRSTWKMFGLKTYGPIRMTTVEPREHLKDPCKQKHHWNDKKESRVVGRPWYNHRPPYIAWTPRLSFWGCVNLRRNKIYHDSSCRYMAQLGHQ